MKARIKSIHLENFKGKKNETYEFDNTSCMIKGQNGAGKTTIATAYYWVLADRDAELNSNPPVSPIGMDEVTPTVEIVFDIDGVEVTACKKQKRTVKGKSVSVSNSYEVNCVEYGERDFKKKMEEYGFNFDLFLPLAHPSVFTGQKSADMRKVLFGMVSDITDLEVAKQTEGAGDVCKLLESYKMEEIEAMQNSTIRKIKEMYGKKGEIVDAKIEGMEATKTDIDTAELELAKAELNRQIEAEQEKVDDITKVTDDIAKKSADVMQMKFDLNDMERKANEVLQKQRHDIDDKIADLQRKLSSGHTTSIVADIARKREEIRRLQVEKDGLGTEWKSVKAEQFDETTKICPTCHRELPEDEIEKLMSDFEQSKADRLKRIETKGFSLKDRIDEVENEISNMKLEQDRVEKEETSVKAEIKQLQEQYDEVPKSVDMSGNKEYQELKLKIEAAEKEVNESKTVDTAALKAHIGSLRTELTSIDKQLALSEKNAEIDLQIEELRHKKLELEQQKADAERIQYQIGLVNMKKNEMLTDSVNSHFKMVKFKLFDYLKNGNVVDSCIPMLDDKPIATHANGALQLLAKLDIISGLQRFYGQYYPVFADDFALVTDNTDSRIDVECQLFRLVADNECKELEVM